MYRRSDVDIGKMILWLKKYISQVSKLHSIDQASVLIDKAVNGEIVDDNLLETTLERDFSEYRRTYHLLFRAAAWGLVLCEIFRRPPWTFRHTDWEDRDRYPVSNTFFIHDGIVVMISAICLVFLGISLLLDAGYEVFSIKLHSQFLRSPSSESEKREAHGNFPSSPNHLSLSSLKLQWTLKTNPKGNMNRIIFFILLTVFILKLTEILFTLLALMLSSSAYEKFRSFPLSTFSPLEAIFLILIEKQYRNLLIVIIRTLPRFLTLLSFLGMGLLLYTVLALRIFDPKSVEAEKYFPSIQEGIWSLITILNAADWPDPLIPAFTDSQLYFLFFFSFLIIGSWGLLNASSGLVFTFFRDQQQKIRSEITMAAFNHISKAYEILVSDPLLDLPSKGSIRTSSRRGNGISIDLFQQLLRSHSWHFTRLKGLRRPNYPLDLPFDHSTLNNTTNTSDITDNKKSSNEAFETDFNILLLVLWFTYKSCHNSDLCSAHISQPYTIPTVNIWTEKWKEKFDVPSNMALIDVSVINNPEIVNTIRKLIGGCSCTCPPGGSFYSHNSNLGSERIPREMFIQFFLVAILREDSESFDLSSIAIPEPSRNEQKIVDLNLEFEDSKRSKMTSSDFDFDVTNVNETPPNRRSDPMLRRKSRRFVTAVTDVLQSPIVKPIYFNEGWRQCWLASRFLYREKPTEYFISPLSSGSGSGGNGDATDEGNKRGRYYFDLKWWNTIFERMISSQEFDILTDALFTTVMILFIGFFPSFGLMITWILYGVFETCLRIYFKGMRRVRRSMRDSSDAMISILMVLILIVYLATGDYINDHSFSLINNYSIPARYLASTTSSSSSSDQRTYEVVMFEGLLTLRGIFITRNIFVIPGMKELRSRLKTAIRRCLQGASDALFLVLLLFTTAFVFGVLGTKSFGGLIQTDGDTTYPSLQNSPFGKSNYYVLNFNDNISALGTLYVLLLVNNMHVIASGYTSISYDIPARIFFVCWYVIAVLFLLNLFTASLLSSFLSFWVLQKRIIYKTKSITNEINETVTNPILTPQDDDDDNNNLNQTPTKSNGNGCLINTQRSASGESNGSHPSPSLYSSFESSPQQCSTIQEREQVFLTTRGRAQTVALNSMDDMFQWFHQGTSTKIWDGDNIDITPIVSETPCQVTNSNGFNPDQTIGGIHNHAILGYELHQDDNSTKLYQRIVNHIPFSTPSPADLLFEQFLEHQQQHNRNSQNSSQESSRWETTLRLSTQFIDSKLAKRDQGMGSQGGGAGAGGEGDSIDPSNTNESKYSPKKPKSKKQWKIWLTETHESITVPEYAALLLHSARRGRRRQMFCTLAAHESFKLRHRFGWIFLFASWCLFFLSFISRPSWTYHENASEYEDKGLYPKANLPMISAEATAVIALIMISIITIGIFLEIKYMSQHENISSISTEGETSTTTSQPQPTTASNTGTTTNTNTQPVSHRGTDIIIHDNTTTGRTFSRRSLSSGSDNCSIIQIAAQDPHHELPHTTSNTTLPISTKITDFFLRNFWKTNYFLSLSTKRFFRLFFILLNVIEISFIFLFLVGHTSTGHHTPSQLERFSSWLAVVYIFWFDYESAAYLHILLSSIQKFLIILSLFGLFIISCVCIGSYDYHLNDYSLNTNDTFDDSVTQDSYFNTFRNSLWTILTSISTTNFPDQLIPFYWDSRSIFIYFFLYLSFGNFIFLNLILIFVMAEYNSSLQSTQQQKMEMRRENLQMAFMVLDVYQRGCLSYTQVYDVLLEVYQSYPEFRGGYFYQKIPTMNEIAVMVAALDVNGDNFIYMEQFMWILHLTQIVIQEKIQGHYLEYLSSNLLHNKLFKRLFHFIGSRKYCSIIDFILLILSAVCLVNDKSISSTNPLTDKIRATIALLMSLDLILQLLILGPLRYLTLKWSLFNLFITIAMISVSFYIKLISHPDSNQLESAHICSSIICIIRVFIFIRNLDYLFTSTQVSLFFATIQRIIKSLSSLLVSFACITYIFALIGVLLFGGLVNKDTSRQQYEILESTAYGNKNYYELNFNSIPSAIITLICLLRVSGWDTFALAMEAVTHTSARLYFILWYLIGVLFLMNIVATLFISGFVVEAAAASQHQHSSSSATASISPQNNSNINEISPSSKKNTPNQGEINKQQQQQQQDLTESLLTPDNHDIEHNYSPLQHLATQLSQFMSPKLHNHNRSSNNMRDEDSYVPPSPSQQQFTYSSSQEDEEEETRTRSHSWNPDISRLVKSSSINEMTTVREGGKLYLISMPRFGKGGPHNVMSGGDGLGLVTEEEEVNQKFMKRIHSLYENE